MTRDDPHRDQPARHLGTPTNRASAVMIMVHGRGAGAADMLALAREFACPEFAFLAPQAAGHSWYPESFLAPVARNEPHLSSGLAKLYALLDQVTSGGIPAERIMLLGFSQGGCLAAEFAARHPSRYGGLIVLSGGLIGPPGTAWPRLGSLSGTPVFLGCSDADPHVPAARVRESAAVLRDLGGEVTERIYPGLGHTVNADEVATARRMMTRLLEPSTTRGGAR